jgi:NitT/TauT family transport system substrate-binding protein
MSSSHEKLTVLIPAPRLSTVFAPIWLAEALGYVVEEGIDVEFDLARSGSPKQAVDGVVTGHGDMTFVNIVFPLMARDQGVPLRVFYGFVRKQNRSFTVPRDSAIRSLGELRGKVIGLHFDDPELFAFAKAALVGEGIDPEHDVTFRPLPGTPLDVRRMARALRSGEVDAVWQLDILSGLMAAEGVLLRHLPSPMIDHLTPSSSMCTLDKNLAARPHVLGGFGRAVAKATVFAFANPAAAVLAVWDRFPGAGPRPDEDRVQVFRGELAALRVRLEGHRLNDQPDARWGSITEAEIVAWQEFLLGTRAIRSRRSPSEYYSDALVPDFNSFDPKPVMAAAARYAVPMELRDEIDAADQA